MRRLSEEFDHLSASLSEAPPSPMWSIKALTFAYRGGSPVYDNFSLELYPGQVYGVLGENGIGKTTLMKLMTSINFPKRGEIRFRGKDVSRRLPSVMSEVFFVPEEVELPSVSKSRFVELYAPFYPRFDEMIFEEWLHNFRVECLGKVDYLSMGDRKKFYLSFAVATGCTCLLLDEPVNGLDILAKDEFKRLIASYMNEERLVLVSTHLGREVEQILDHLLILNKEGIALQASFEEIAGNLLFSVVPGTKVPADALYAEAVPGGTKVLRPNTEEIEDNYVDVEFLFKAMFYNPMGISKVWDGKKGGRL